MSLDGFALIPARGGSKGIKDKNLQYLGEYTLIGRTIKQAQSAGFKRVIVLSDSERIRMESLRLGAEVGYERPKSISLDNTHMFVVYKWLINEMIKNEKVLPDFFCTLLCTTPFRKLEHVKLAKQTIESGEYDWVLSVNEYEHHPYRAMSIGSDGFLTPSYDVPEGMIWANRQELPLIYRFNGGIISGLTKHVINNDEYNISFGTNLKIFPVKMTQEESIDIDNPIDLELARMVVAQKND